MEFTILDEAVDVGLGGLAAVSPLCRPIPAGYHLGWIRFYFDSDLSCVLNSCHLVSASGGVFERILTRKQPCEFFPGRVTPLEPIEVLS